MFDKLHEECGVFGMYAPIGQSVAKDIYYGLTALQHRGQESAGMAVWDTAGEKGNLTLKKDMGLVSEVFDAKTLGILSGNLGVGHVRYSTTGGSRPENAQPIAMHYIKGTLALVHNGNLTNADALKEQQMYRGQAHYTTTDSEVLAYEVISARLQCGCVEDAVRKAAEGLKGGYAVLVMSPRKLVGMRDPFGLKPLILGRRGEAYMMASESAAIEAAGGEVIRDIRPGEIVTVTKDGIKSDTSLCSDKVAHCIFEYIYFARNDSVIDGIEVQSARMKAGEALAKREDPGFEADLVAGVPDSGLSAAQGYAAYSQIPFGFAFHKNSYIGRSFIKPANEERADAVHMKLSVLKSAVKNKRVVLIDDSIVRGNTMKQIVELLRKNGAKEVHVRISSPPFLHPCFYGTDVANSSQLIASGHSTEQICESIGADSLSYLQIADFETMVGKMGLCTACFSGEYPV
ncbi:MAG: amidophosphoribosyltransferase [Lachnospiraceae bacterium]|nr:amidophosphoribosyltransferase [Lachnospiraceae bacterium]